jgi:hypothetical protein
MSAESQLVLMIAGVHLLGLIGITVLLIPALREPPPPSSQSDSDSDDGGGKGPPRPPVRPDAPRGGIPLPDAVPARVRLRDERPLFERLPARRRRPATEPGRRPVRVRP